MDVIRGGARDIVIFDSVTVAEAIPDVVRGNARDVNLFDSVTIAENILTTNGSFLTASISDLITVSEQVGIHRVRPGWSTNWTPDTTIPTTKWKKDPN